MNQIKPMLIQLVRPVGLLVIVGTLLAALPASAQTIKVASRSRRVDGEVLS